MLRHLVDADPVARFLFERCSMTEAQLDTLLICITASREGRRLDEKVAMRDSRLVSKGAFLTTFRQARERVSKSAYTLILLEHLGLLEKGSVSGLLRVGTMLRGTPSNALSEEQAKMILPALGNIVEKLTNH